VSESVVSYGISAQTKQSKADILVRITPISSTQVLPMPPSDAVPTLRNHIRTKWQAT